MEPHVVTSALRAVDSVQAGGSHGTSRASIADGRGFRVSPYSDFRSSPHGNQLSTKGVAVKAHGHQSPWPQGHVLPSVTVGPQGPE